MAYPDGSKVINSGETHRTFGRISVRIFSVAIACLAVPLSEFPRDPVEFSGFERTMSFAFYFCEYIWKGYNPVCNRRMAPALEYE